MPRVTGAATHEVLTNAASVMALTYQQATQRISISITGVVTLAEPAWDGPFFVQDLTGGVWVNNNKNRPPALGDLVQVTGVSGAGGFAPDILSPKWKKVGTAPLPEAKLVSVERLMSGAEDGCRIEVSGVVRSARAAETDTSRLWVELAAGGYRFWAFLPGSKQRELYSLVGASIRVKGTAAAAFNRRLRQIRGINVFVPQESDLIIERRPETRISELPLTSLRGILQYRRSRSDELRVRVKGKVTYQRPGKDVFLQDARDGLEVRCRETNVFAPGEIIEAVGFPVMERNLPVLQDAILFRKKEASGPIAFREATIQQVLETTFYHGNLITLKGTLLDRSLRPLREGNSVSNAPAENILTLQCSNYLVSISAPAARRFDGLASIPIGSVVEVSGLCLLQVSGGTTIPAPPVEAVEILLPDVANIRILRRPSWWTAEHLLTGLGILLTVLMVGAIWALMILRKNSALKTSIAEKMEAQGELQRAHDMLESRVEERTKELKVEIGARKEAEVRVDAIVAERKRIAQELHDTLLQGFTAFGLRLDALSNALPPSLATTKEQMQKLLEKSDEYLLEARRAVWELRSPSIERTGDFSRMLMKVSERALEGTGIPLRFSASGAVSKSAPAIEDNLLRICEEAVTNAAKHARPVAVEVAIECTANEIRLRVRDDGCGFNPEGPDGSKVGHLGLVGMRERAKTAGGNISVTSRPGKGTEIVVTVRQNASITADNRV